LYTKPYRILVTGGLGFLGSNLVKELRRRGHDVWLCDLRHDEDPKSIRCDVSEFRQVERLFEGRNFDYVYHLAAEFGRWNGEDYFENLWMTNTVGTKNMLRLQEKKRFRMLFSSSSEVYGDYEGIMREDVMDKVPIKQMNDYAITKWVNEMQILNSATMFNTESVRVRLFNVYGPGEYYTPYRGLIPTIIFKALRDEQYTVYREHKRTYVYVDDVCNALANIVKVFKSGEVYNLGSDKSYEIKDISDMVLKYLGKSDSRVVYKEAEQFTTRAKIPDSTKAKRDLDFKPSMTLENGMPRTIEWFKEEYKNK
jgi:dTDP-glucose 4,6-dehydratase